ncbi:MAG: hypothetical protein IKD69_07220 [Solobacterium sp.]|nr:hypothetical protein [Solobacterium sp.]
MENDKNNNVRKILNIVLLLLNAACLVWILFSWRAEHRQSQLDYYRNRGVDVTEFENTDHNGTVQS